MTAHRQERFSANIRDKIPWMRFVVKFMTITALIVGVVALGYTLIIPFLR